MKYRSQCSKHFGDTVQCGRAHKTAAATAPTDSQRGFCAPTCLCRYLNGQTVTDRSDVPLIIYKSCAGLVSGVCGGGFSLPCGSAQTAISYMVSAMATGDRMVNSSCLWSIQWKNAVGQPTYSTGRGPGDRRQHCDRGHVHAPGRYGGRRPSSCGSSLDPTLLPIELTTRTHEQHLRRGTHLAPCRLNRAYHVRLSQVHTPGACPRAHLDTY